MDTAEYRDVPDPARHGFFGVFPTRRGLTRHGSFLSGPAWFGLERISERTGMDQHGPTRTGTDQHGASLDQGTMLEALGA